MCDNRMLLTHQDKERIASLEMVLQSSENAEVFHHLRPRPVEFDGDWYDWNSENWGTKWEMVVNDFQKQHDHAIIIEFLTAWTPPIPLYEFLVTEGWEIKAYFHESACAFCGKFTNEEGYKLYEYDFDDRESMEAIPSDIEDFTGLLENHDECKEESDYTDRKEK
jgi:hypothetical protein